MKLVDAMSIQEAENHPSFKGKKHIVVLKKQGYKCASCSAIALELVLVWNTKLKMLDKIITAIRSNGQETRMTIDHIKPISKGGKNCWNNYQIMCRECNNRKSNQYIQKEN